MVARVQRLVLTCPMGVVLSYCYKLLTARTGEHQVGPRVLLHALCHYTLRAKIILTDFNFRGFNPDHQTTKFNSPINFPAIWYKYYRIVLSKLKHQKWGVGGYMEEVLECLNGSTIPTQAPIPDAKLVARVYQIDLHCRFARASSRPAQWWRKLCRARKRTNS